MGFMIKLTEAATDNTLPKLYADPILSEGSIVLIDFSHSLGGGSVLPSADGAIINNIAANSLTSPAYVLAAATDTASMKCIVSNNMASNQGKVEFSLKKGLHVAYSKVNDADNIGYNISLPLKIKQYLFANDTHTYFSSIWSKITRSYGYLAAGYSFLASNGGSNNVFNNYITLDGSYGHSGVSGEDNSYSTSKRVDGNITGIVGNLQRNVAAQGWDKVGGASGHTYPVSADGLSAIPFSVGRANGWGFFLNHLAGSMVMYRFYMEDLTVSGRSYAQVDTIDKGLYDAAFAVGGKFYGDTYSDPATLVP